MDVASDEGDIPNISYFLPKMKKTMEVTEVIEVMEVMDANLMHRGVSVSLHDDSFPTHSLTHSRTHALTPSPPLA
jgi:hypothetical protein